MNLTDQEQTEIHDRLARMGDGPLGFAVSGGGDSQALVAIAAQWARANGRRILAVTVDHGLRAEAKAEAQAVAAFCREFSIAHTILQWEGWDGQGNLQDLARRARYELITDWALGAGVSAVATGHTMDDQAETVLLRLARGSGVDGLAGMAEVTTRQGIDWHRPLLAVRRAALRDYLTLEGIPWVEDPSNEDERFDRVKARKVLAQLEPLGIGVTGLVRTASRMTLARSALQMQTRDLARAVTTVDRGDVVLDWGPMKKAPREIFERLLTHVLMWVSGAEYRPRMTALETAAAAIAEGKTTVLSGCLITAEGGYRRVTRELAAVADLRAHPGDIWDGRWRLDGPEGEGAQVAALGEMGIRDCPHWRDTGLPRTSLIASPSVWRDNRLIAAPLAGFDNGWRASPVKAADSLIEAIITH